MKAALYARVSTLDQSADTQIDELNAYCNRQSWTIHDTYQDTISGSKSKRPGLDRLMADARLKRFDCVVVWKLDRFGRSLVDCLNNLQALESAGIRFLAITQGLDTDHRNPVARFIVQVLGAAAEFERSLIVERSRLGQQKYKKAYADGKVGKTVHSHSGMNKAPHRPKKVFDRRKVVELRKRGMSLRGIARRMDIGLGTVSRTLDEWKDRSGGDQ